MASTQTSLRSAGWVSLWSFAQLIVQFGFQVVLAKYFGASADMDAFVAAIALPTVLSSIFIGSLGYALVPTFAERLGVGDTEKAWATANSLLLVLAVFTGLSAGAICLAARPLTEVLYPGFSSQQAEQTARLVTVLSWLMVTNGLIAYSQAIHHCHKRFSVPAIAPVLGIGTTLAIVLLFQDSGIDAVGAAVLLGSVVTAAVQFAFPLFRFRLRFRMDDGARRCLRLMLPLVCGAAYYRLDPLVDRYLASELPTGSVSHLGYAARLVTALLLISTSGLAVVAFPNLAIQRAAGRLDEFRAEVAHALRCLCVIITPIVVGLGWYAHPTVRCLFERGEFTASDTKTVALLLVLYMGMVVAAAYGDIAAKVFYALSDTRTPTIIGCVGFTLGVALKLALTPAFGVAGIVAATSCYYLANVATMMVLILRRTGRGAFSGIGGSFLRSLLASGLALVTAWPLVRWNIAWGLPLGAIAGAIVYVSGMLIQRDEFAVRLWNMLTGKGGEPS